MPNDSAQFASRVYYMAESTPAQIRMRDSLSEVNRNERCFPLGISIIQWFPMREVTQSLPANSLARLLDDQLTTRLQRTLVQRSLRSQSGFRCAAIRSPVVPNTDLVKTKTLML